MPEFLLPLITASAVRGALLLAPAIVAVAALRRRSAAVRHAVLAAALAAQLLIPLASLTVPERIVPRLPVRLETPIARVEGVIFERLPGIAASPARPTDARAAAAPNESSPRALALALWLAGAAMVLLWLVAGRIRVHLLGRRLDPVHQGPVADARDVAAASLGERRSIRLLVGGPFAVPITWGVLHPVVLMPAGSDQWPEDRLELALVHELAHIRRLDAAMNLIGCVAAAVFWFNPLVWIALRLQRALAERAADDGVLGTGVRASSYVDTLVAMVKETRAAGSFGGAAFAMARRSEFEGRMLAVLDDRVRRAPAGVIRLGFSVIPLLLLSLAAIPTRVESASPAPALDRALADPDQGAPPRPPRPEPPPRAGRSAAVGRPPAARDDLEADARLTIAGRLSGPERAEELRALVEAGPLSAGQASRYIELASRMRGPIERSIALTALVRAVALDSSQLDRVLVIVDALEAQVPTATTLAALARGQSLGPAHRRTYYTIAARLEGGALRTAIDALR